MATRVFLDTLGVVSTAKRLKQTFLLLRCHANAVVGHLETNCAVAGVSHFLKRQDVDVHDTAHLAKFDCISKYVRQDLLNALHVDKH